MSLVLFAPDVATADSVAAAHWVLDTCRALRARGHEVMLHPRERQLGWLATSLEAEGVRVLPYDAESADQEDEVGHAPRFRARRVVALARRNDVQWVLAQGLNLCMTLTGARALRDKLWSLPFDAPFRTEPVGQGHQSRVENILAGSHRLLVAAEAQRAELEARFPATTSKVTLMPAPSPGAQDTLTPPADDSSESRAPDLLIDLDYFTEDSLPELWSYADATRDHRDVPAFLVAGSSASSLRDHPLWRNLPGAQVLDSRPPTSAAVAIIPSHVQDPVAHAHAWARAADEGRLTIAVTTSPTSQHLPGVHFVDSAAALLNPLPLTPSRPVSTAVRPDASTSGWFPQDREHLALAHPDGRRLRVVLAGSDFKFAGDLIRALSEHPDVDLRVDVFGHHSTAQPDVSRDYAAWADVVIAEFAQQNAVWYSQNLRAHQRLLVHLHGFELLGDVVDALDLAQCAAIVVPSSFYRDQAAETKGWAHELIHVVPNSVDEDDLHREKFQSARFHLGLAGYAPILKRPDRALDLVRMLRAEDERYTLHLRGHSPWNYTWEWKKSAHQSAYREFFRAAGQDERLMEGLSFEPFGPDMGNWLRRVGWILSPSYRETFHLAAVEGAASGAIPLVWTRDGSEEIFSDRWNFTSTEAVADFVLATNASAESYARESRRARGFVSRYDRAAVAQQWFDLLRTARDEIAAARIDSRVEIATAGQPHLQPERAEERLLAEVEACLEDGSYARALAALDTGISVTAKSRGRLKDAELWVRGVAALDARRFALYLPRVPRTVTVHTTPLMVRVAGSSSTRWARHGLELTTLDVEPFPYTDPRDLVPGADPADIQPDLPVGVSRLGRFIRADRWIEAHASTIAARCSQGGIDHLVARGPWWIALAAAVAADRLGIPATWILTSATDVQRAERAVEDPFDSDTVDYLVLRTLEGMSRVVDETDQLRAGPLASRIPLADLPVTDLPATMEVATHSPSPDYGGLPSAVERNAEDLHVLAAGAEAFVASWRATGARVTALDIDAVDSPVVPTVDLVVIDLALAQDPAWTSPFTAASATGPSRMSKLFDSARLVGARTLAVAHDVDSWPDDLLATLRKADVLTATSIEKAEPVLRLNPLSVERVLPAAGRPWERNPTSFLRSLGLPVGMSASGDETASTCRTGSGTPEGSAFMDPDTDLAPVDTDSAALEGISLILATHRGAHRIGQMLDSLGAQTLPHHLIELIVVENGGEPESRAQVEQFAATHDMQVRYIFREKAGVGAARNAGIAAATRDYLAFLDDDDEIEPNFLLSAWLSSSPDSIVLSALHDQTVEGSRRTDTPTANRLNTLRGRGRLPAGLMVGALELNACKLVPTQIAQQLRYPENLHSGEDVVFMAQLLKYGLSLVPAAPMDKSAYIRHMRPNSVSRREFTFDFAVTERLAVISALVAIRRTLTQKQEIGAIATLVRGQSSFISRYRDAHPSESGAIDAAIAQRGLTGEVIQ